VRSVLPQRPNPSAYVDARQGPADLELLIACGDRWKRCLRDPQVAIHRLSRQGRGDRDLCDRLALCFEKADLCALRKTYGVPGRLNFGWLLNRCGWCSCGLWLRRGSLRRCTEVESGSPSNRSCHGVPSFHLPLSRIIGSSADNLRSTRSRSANVPIKLFLRSLDESKPWVAAPTRAYFLLWANAATLALVALR